MEPYPPVALLLPSQDHVWNVEMKKKGGERKKERRERGKRKGGGKMSGCGWEWCNTSKKGKTKTFSLLFWFLTYLKKKKEKKGKKI